MPREIKFELEDIPDALYPTREELEETLDIKSCYEIVPEDKKIDDVNKSIDRSLKDLKGSIKHLKGEDYSECKRELYIEDGLETLQSEYDTLEAEVNELKKYVEDYQKSIEGFAVVIQDLLGEYEEFDEYLLELEEKLKTSKLYRFKNTMEKAKKTIELARQVTKN